MISGVPPVLVPHTGSPALIASTETGRWLASTAHQADVGGCPVAAEVARRSVDRHQVVDAQTLSKLAKWFLVSRTDERQLDVDTGLSGNSDCLDCKVLSLGVR